MSKEIKCCAICARQAFEGKNVAWLTGLDAFMCAACLAIWYDGCSNTEEIKRHSLFWNPNSYGAYRKSSYLNEAPWMEELFNPEVLPAV